MRRKGEKLKVIPKFLAWVIGLKMTVVIEDAEQICGKNNKFSLLHTELKIPIDF